MGKLLLGYARVSTDDQTTALQADALAKAGCARICTDKASGKSTAARPQLEECLADLREGDTLVVWRLDRLGRSVLDLARIVGELGHRGVNFQEPDREHRHQYGVGEVDVPHAGLDSRVRAQPDPGAQAS